MNFKLLPLVAALSFSLIGCGGGGGGSDTVAPPVTPEVTPPVEPEVTPPVEPEIPTLPSTPLPTTPCDDGSCLEDDGFMNPNLPGLELEPSTPIDHIQLISNDLNIDYNLVMTACSSDWVDCMYKDNKSLMWSYGLIFLPKSGDLIVQHYFNDPSNGLTPTNVGMMNSYAEYNYSGEHVFGTSIAIQNGMFEGSYDAFAYHKLTPADITIMKENNVTFFMDAVFNYESGAQIIRQDNKVSPSQVFDGVTEFYEILETLSPTWK